MSSWMTATALGVNRGYQRKVHEGAPPRTVLDLDPRCLELALLEQHRNIAARGLCLGTLLLLEGSEPLYRQPVRQITRIEDKGVDTRRGWRTGVGPIPGSLSRGSLARIRESTPCLCFGRHPGRHIDRRGLSVTRGGYTKEVDAVAVARERLDVVTEAVAGPVLRGRR